MKRFTVSLLLVLLVTQPLTVLAFKPKTHIWVAQQVLNDVVPDGKITINGREYAVAPDTVEALRLFPSDYRMGHIGPDAFPDPVVGQMTAHPGIANEWQTDNWLSWMLAGGNIDSRMRAFTHGYIGHAAGDLFAHSYVNTYTGDIFVLSDGEQTNELRHFALESFIAKHTPPLVDHNNQPIGAPEDILSVPAKQLRNHLVVNNDVQRQYRIPEALALHLVYMHTFRRVVDETSNIADALAIKYQQQLSLLDALKLEAAKEADKYVGPIAQAKYNIDAAQAVLKIYDEQLAVQQKILDESIQEIDKAQRLIDEAQNKLSTLPNVVRDVKNELAGIEDKLLQTPRFVSKEVCRPERKRVRRWISVFLGWQWIWITETVCRVEPVLNDV